MGQALRGGVVAFLGLLTFVFYVALFVAGLAVPISGILWYFGIMNQTQVVIVLVIACSLLLEHQND